MKQPLVAPAPDAFPLNYRSPYIPKGGSISMDSKWGEKLPVLKETFITKTLVDFGDAAKWLEELV